MNRAMYGTTTRVSVATGRISSCSCVHGPWSGASSTVGGSQLKTTVPNSRTSPMPETNSGSAAMPSSPSELPLSNTESRLSAPSTPSESARGIAMTAEIATRKAELRTESLITSITGVSVASDVPGLPVSRPLTNDQYWSISGRFRCSVSRSALRLSGVAFRPSSARAGSVGSATVAANTITETIARVTIPSATRRRMKPLIPWNGRAKNGREARVGSAAGPPVSLMRTRSS